MKNLLQYITGLNEMSMKSLLNKDDVFQDMVDFAKYGLKAFEKLDNESQSRILFSYYNVYLRPVAIS